MGDGNAWMFQYRLEWYDLMAEFNKGMVIEDWQAIQRTRNMQIGDRVYILRAGGRDGSEAAQLEAVGQLFSPVFSGVSFRTGEPLNKVNVEFSNLIVPPLTRAEIRRDSILGQYHPFAIGRTGTNFLLPDDIASRTAELVRDRLSPLPPASVQNKVHVADIFRHVGKPYEPANEERLPPEITPFLLDPERIALANRSHANLQNKLAQHLARLGYTPRSPRPDEPNFDIAWTSEGSTCVGEVKSITRLNEEAQIRLGLGQVLLYRHLLAERYGSAAAVLFIHKEPANPAWSAVCRDAGVTLLWPSILPQFSGAPTQTSRKASLHKS